MWRTQPTCIRILAARRARSFEIHPPPSNKRAQGRPGARSHPWSACNKNARGRTTGTGGSSGLPCAVVLTVSFALSSATGLFCHRRRAGLLPAEPGRAGTRLAQLDASVGASGPHDFSVRGSLAKKPHDELGTSLAEAFTKVDQRRSSARRGVAHGLSSAPCDPRSRARRCRVHRIPRSTSVTIAIRPSDEAGRAKYEFDLGLSRSDLFLRGGVDRVLQRLPVGQIT
jgi:hypothetical protein